VKKQGIEQNRAKGGAYSLEKYRIDRWVITPARNTIATRGTEQSIEPKVMQVLLCLISRQGDVVTRAEIEDEVWPNAFIGDKSLTRAISELRRVFGDSAVKPEIIETVARRGYRLVAPAKSLQKRDVSRKFALIVAMAVTTGIVGVWISQDKVSSRQEVIPWRQLTTQVGHELTPAPSPSGELVAYARTPEGEQSTSIYLKQFSGDTELRLTNDSAFDISPRWSPDGSQIVFMRYDGTACEVLVVAALGGDIRKLASCNLQPPRVNFSPTIDWAPGGRRIAYVDGGPGGRCIVILELNTGTKTLLNAASMMECQDDVDPVFSPDGKSIAFTRFSQRSIGDLYVTNLVNSRTTRLTEDYRTQLGATWESARSILFSSDRSGTYRLWRVDLVSREITWVAADGWNIKRPYRNGVGVIAYESWQYDTNIWTETGGDSSPTRIISSTVWDYQPSLSPDGQQIVFVSNRSGNFELWLRDSHGNQRQLTNTDNRVVGHAAWSPDGNQLAYVVQAADLLEIAIITLDGDEIGRIRPSGNAIAPTWSPDGETLIYGSNTASNWQIWAYKPATNDQQQLTQTIGYRGAINSQGHLYFTKPGKAGLWRLQLDKSEEKVIDDLSAAHWADWYIVQDKIVYPLPFEKRLIVWDWKNPAEVVRIPTDAITSANAQSIQVSNDLERIIWSQLDNTEADIFVGRLPEYD